MKKDFSEIMNKDTTTIGGSVNHDIVGVGVGWVRLYDSAI